MEGEMASSSHEEEAQISKDKVIIVGAGISGLALGVQILKHASKYYEPIIFEKAKCFEDATKTGFVVSITPNATHVLEDMGFKILHEDFVFPMNRAVLHDSRKDDPKPLAVAEGIFDDPKSLLTVERGPLQKLLLDKYIELGGEIRFGKCLIGVVQSELGGEGDGGNYWKVEALFSDGTSQGGDIIVGADGIHSGVRKHLFSVLPRHEEEEDEGNTLTILLLKCWGGFVIILYGMMHFFCLQHWTPEKEKKDDLLLQKSASWEAKQTPWTALYGITSPVPKSMIQDGEGTMHWFLCETGGYSTYPLNNDRIFWIAHEVEPKFSHENRECPFTIGQARDAMSRFSDKPYINGTTFKRLMSFTERVYKTRVYHGVFDRIADDNLGIALVGDAAHAAAIYVGQGAVLGIEESVVLVNGLLRKKWAELGLLPDPPSPPRPRSIVEWYASFFRSEEQHSLVGMEYYEYQRLARCKRVADISWWLGWSLMGEVQFWRVIRDVFLRTGLPWMLKDNKRRSPKERLEDDDDDDDEDEREAESAKPSSVQQQSTNAAATGKIKVVLNDYKQKQWDHWLFDTKFHVDEEIFEVEEEEVKESSRGRFS